MLQPMAKPGFAEQQADKDAVDVYFTVYIFRLEIRACISFKSIQDFQNFISPGLQRTVS